jgi:hypothetical protein
MVEADRPTDGGDLMTRAAIAALLAALLPAVAGAQAPGERLDRVQDRRELGQDRHEIRDDRRDLARLEGLLERYDAARASRNRREMLQVEDEIARTLAREASEARAEAARSRAELRREAHDGRRDPSDDRRELRDDRRDLRDDRRDAHRVAAIEREFGSLRGRMNRRSLDRKRVLLDELRRMALAELREDRRELREDHRR